MPCTRPELNLPGAARAASVNSLTLLYGASCFDRHREDGVGHARDRDQLRRVVGQVFVRERMHDESSGWPKHQDMIVVGAEVGLDGNDAVAARLVFDNDRLPPFGLQLFGE